MPQDRLIPERDPTLRPAGEILRRLAFVLHVVSGLGGVALLIASGTMESPVLAGAGAAALAVCAGLHLLGRRRLGFAEIGAEIRRNPFKPRCGDVSDDDHPAPPPGR